MRFSTRRSSFVFPKEKFFLLPSSDDRPADLREVLSQQASLWEPLEAVLRLRLLPGEQTISKFKLYSFRFITSTLFDTFCFLYQECQKKLEHKLGLDSYLLKPVQRITKYQLLLKVRNFLFATGTLYYCSVGLQFFINCYKLIVSAFGTAGNAEVQ